MIATLNTLALECAGKFTRRTYGAAELLGLIIQER